MPLNPEDLARLDQLVRQFAPTSVAAISPETHLGPNGLGLDSIAVAEFLLRLEEHFAVDVSPLLDGEDKTLAQIAGFLANAPRTR